jgi:hypothetical protein
MSKRSKHSAGIGGITVALGVLTIFAIALAVPGIASRRAKPSRAAASASAPAHALPHWAVAAGMLGAPLLAAQAGTASGNAFNGLADYPTPGAYSFTVPDGITSLEVWFYGAGGGGSAGNGVVGGGFGGSGALAVSVVSVTAGDTYTVNVGAGGKAGDFDHHGFDGGATTLVDPNGNVIVGAGGGGGGAATGQPGQGGKVIGNPMIGRPGHAAGFGLGYQPPTLIDAGSVGVVSAGGLGGSGVSAPGENGYAFIAY